MTLALLAATALVAAVVQAATGLGFALVLGPAVFALLEPEAAIVAITLLGFALNGLVLFGERRRPVVAWDEIRPLLAAAVPGAICGVLILKALPKSALQVAVGGAVIVAAALREGARRRAVGATPGDPRQRLALGFATGTLTTSAGVNGPPLALWLSHRGLRPADMRDTLSAAFLGLEIIGGAVLAPALAVSGAEIDWGALAIAFGCVIAGHAVGRRAFAHLDGARYEPVLLVLVTVAGVASVLAGLL